MWEELEVAVRRGMVKRIDHPVAGPLEFECQRLRVCDSDQTMIVYCAAPGSTTEAAFRRLAAESLVLRRAEGISVPDVGQLDPSTDRSCPIVNQTR